MIKLFDVREPKSPPSPSSPHARHHTRSPEELRLQKGEQLQRLSDSSLPGPALALWRSLGQLAAPCSSLPVPFCERAEMCVGALKSLQMDKRDRLCGAGAACWTSRPPLQPARPPSARLGGQ